MDSSDETTSKKAMPPYGSVPWYSKFFNVCERIKVDKVDSQFIKNYEITANGVEYKIINGLRFLGLVTSDGTATEKMKSLGVVGPAFQKNLSVIISEAYTDLFSKIRDIQNAKSEDLVNYFRAEYEMAPSMADQSAKIFVFLAQKAGITLSPDVTESFGFSEEGRSSSKPSRETKQKRTEGDKGRITKTPKESFAQSGKKPEGNYVLIPDEMIRLEYQNKVLMFLPKGNKQTRQAAAKLARQFIDTYETEEGEEENISTLGN